MRVLVHPHPEPTTRSYCRCSVFGNEEFVRFHQRLGVHGHGASRRKKVLARKWRPPFFLLPGAKKVGRYKSSQIDGLCLEAPAPCTEKWRFWSSKKRRFPPFFDDSARVCPQAYRTDRAGWSNRPDRTDQTKLAVG